MPTLLSHPMCVQSAGTKAALIDEYIGHLNLNNEAEARPVCAVPAARTGAITRVRCLEPLVMCLTTSAVESVHRTDLYVMIKRTEGHMSPKLESMFEPLTRSASVKSVYGEAIAANGKTIIPVARVAYGFGGGRGRKHQEEDSPEGEGGGGGVYAVPIGVIEVTDAETRFIPLSDKRRLAGAALIGFCLGAWWARRRKG